MQYEVHQRLKDLSEHDQEKIARSLPVENAVVELDHIQREKGRLKIRSLEGDEVRIFIQRGQLLGKGELLPTRCGHYIRVALAKEQVVTAVCDDWFAFAQACYHLGNRHTRIQIGERWLRFLPDPVLIELVEKLGLTTSQEYAEFIPEAGAYAAKHSHNHSHDHDHGDGQKHSHAN